MKKDEAINYLENMKWLKGYDNTMIGDKPLVDIIDRIITLLKEQEAVEGHWIPIESPTGVEAFGIKEMTVQFVRCSVCDAEEDVSFSAYRFCPRCGAKMDRR